MKLAKYLFWGCMIFVFLFLLINISVDSNDFSNDDDTFNILYCGYAEVNLSVSCEKTSDCIDYESAKWSNKGNEWDIVEGSGNLNENFNRMLNKCVYCSNNRCFSSVVIRNTNY